MADRSVEALGRIKNVLMSDKTSSPERVAAFIKADAYELLSAYADIRREDMELSLELDGNGKFIIRITATATRFKDIGISP